MIWTFIIKNNSDIVYSTFYEQLCGYLFISKSLNEFIYFEINILDYLVSFLMMLTYT